MECVLTLVYQFHCFFIILNFFIVYAIRCSVGTGDVVACCQYYCYVTYIPSVFSRGRLRFESASSCRTGSVDFNGHIIWFFQIPGVVNRVKDYFMNPI